MRLIWQMKQIPCRIRYCLLLFLASFAVVFLLLCACSCSVLDTSRNDLLKSINKGSTNEREKAIYGLANEEVRTVKKQLLRMALEDNSELLRTAAIRRLVVLDYMDTEDKLKVFHKSIKDESLNVRIATLCTINAVGDPIMAPVVVEGLNDKNEIVRKLASEDLFIYFTQTSSVNEGLLNELLDDNNRYVKINAAFALAWRDKANDHVISTLVSAYKGGISNFLYTSKIFVGLEQCGAGDTRVEELMVSIINNSNVSPELNTIFAEAVVGTDVLGLIQEQSGGSSLLQELGCYDCDRILFESVAGNGYLTLLPVYDNGWVDTLIVLISNEHMRAKAVDTLGITTGYSRKYIPLLISLLEEELWNIRLSAIEYIGQCIDVLEDQELVSVIADMSENDESEKVREEGEYILSLLGAEQDIEGN